MRKGEILKGLQTSAASKQKLFAVLIDPDDLNPVHLKQIAQLSEEAGVDFFLIGGSLLMEDALDWGTRFLKKETNRPVVLFPGNNLQISDEADAILLLSLISGRNPDLLIGQHVIAAPRIARSGLEVIPTGYMLVDGGVATSVHYMSNTQPIPRDKSDIALATALAGGQLGLQSLYLDAGSGALNSVNNEMLTMIKNHVDNPLFVGGGIRSAQEVYDKGRAGADVVVVGNAIEKDPSLIMEMGVACKESSTVR